MWETAFLAWSPFPRPKPVVGLGTKHHLFASAVGPFTNFLSQSRKELYRELVAGSSDPLRILWRNGSAVVRGDSLPVELGARHEHFEHLRVLAHQATRSKRVGPQRLHIRQTWLSPLRFRRNGLARLLLLRAGSLVLEPRRRLDGSHQPQTARAARHKLRHGQCWLSVSGWEAKGVSRDPSCSQNGDLGDAKQGIVWGCKFFSSGSDLVH